MASDRLFELLTEALSRPSKTYRAAKAGLDIPGQALEGYDKGAKFSDDVRKRKLGQQTLEDALAGGGLEKLTAEQGTLHSPTITGMAALEKARREQKEKNSRAQQANFKINDQLVEYDPDLGYYPARINMNGAPTGQQTSEAGPTPAPTKEQPPLNIGPRVAPTVPAEQLSKNAGMEDLLNDVSIIRKTKKPEYIGMYDYPKTLAKQRVGYKATDEAGRFTQTVSRMKNKILNLRSGGQITDGEAGRLLQELVIGTTSEEDFDARLDGFENAIKNILAERQKAFSQAGYRTPGATQRQPPPRNDQKSGPPEFNTSEEAEQSGVKGLVIIGGRRAVIE